MNRSILFVSFAFLCVLAIYISLQSSSKIEEEFSAEDTEIGALMGHMGNMDSAEVHIKEQMYENRMSEKSKDTGFKDMNLELKEAYDRNVCKEVPQFENVSLTDFTKAKNHDGTLMFSKTYHIGRWDEETKECKSPFPDKPTDVICSDYNVDCASEGTDRLIHRIGTDGGDVCKFENCPMYCMSYNLDCHELYTKGETHSFVPVIGIRSNCLNPVDDNYQNCLKPTKENCPSKYYFYYDDDNRTVRSNLYTVSVGANKTCVYSHDVGDRLVFATYEDALKNCDGKNAFKTCYTPNGANNFLETKHRLNRFHCGYDKEPRVCKDFSEVSCAPSPPYFSKGVSMFDSERGTFDKTYSSKTVAQSLSKTASGYSCAHTAPSGTIPNEELREDCRKDCFSSDGSELATKYGVLNADKSRCTVHDCYAESQKVGPEDCADEAYYYYDADNTTVKSGLKAKSVVNNACVYVLPNYAPRTTFATEEAARANCPSKSPTKTCYYPGANGDLISRQHALDRSTCEYVGITPDCVTNVDAGEPCEGTSTYYKVQGATTYREGRASKPVLSEEVPNELEESPSGNLICAPGLAPPGYEANPECKIECYTSTSGSRRVSTPGVVDGGYCMVPGGCFESTVEGFADASPVASLMSQITDQQDAAQEVNERKSTDGVVISEREETLRGLKSEINRELKKGACLNVAQFESFSTSNVAAARHQDGFLMINKGYHKGVWNEEKGECVNTTSDTPKVHCANYTVECAGSNTNNVSLRVGADHPDFESVCAFDACPVYCLSYDEDCWELKSDQGQYSFQRNAGSRSQCANPSDEKDSRCVEPDVSNCPSKEYHYYDFDNVTIRSDSQTATLENNVCVYSKAITDRPTFETMQEARANKPEESA